MIFLCLLGLILQSQVAFAQCDQDTIPPVVQIPANLTISCEIYLNNDLDDPAVRDQLFGTATVMDDCEIIQFDEQYESNLTACASGTLSRQWLAIDENNNATLSPIQTIVLTPISDILLQIPVDATPGTSADTLIALEEECSLGVISWTDIIWSFDCNGDEDEFERTYTYTDWCALDPTIILPPTPLPRLDTNNDGVFGDAYEVRIIESGAYLWENGQLGEMLAPYAAQYEYVQENDLAEDLAIDIHVQGTVFNDLNENCTLENDETGIPNYSIRISNLSNGQSAFTISDSLGNYELGFCATGDTIEISSYNPFNASGSCLSTTTIVLTPGTTALQVDLPLYISCEQLLVDIGLPFLRRCFNNKYYVSYQNLSPLAKEDVYIDIMLDDFMTYTSSSIPAVDLGNQLYRFELGDLPALNYGTFTINFDLSCEAELGQTHCSSAAIYPVNECEEQNNSNWSGASIAISGACEGDSLSIKIENIGISNMQESSNYIIVEDVIMMSINPFQLNAGEIHSFKLPATGEAWHVAAEQVAFHPGNSMPSLTIEGCGGNNNPGVAMNFPQNDADPGVAIDCSVNIGSFDPNDKRAAPRGIGAEREIAANVGMEYMIRFQNTGTDTAFTVVVEDQLSELLNINTIIPGVSSHDYVFNRLPDNTIRFTYENIELPDSSSNMEGSQGFVKFNILQEPDNAPGSVINNQAAIYFDFNDPVITNDAFVKIVEHPFGVISYIPELLVQNTLTVFPNPTQSGRSVLQFDSPNFQAGELNVYNINGQLLRSQEISSPKTSLDFTSWPKGVYPLEFIIESQKVETGKIIIQ